MYKLFVLISILFMHDAFGQKVPKTIAYYDLKQKHSIDENYSKIEIDSINLNPFDRFNKSLLTIIYGGGLFTYHFDIAFDNQDTVGILTIYIYEVIKDKITKEDRILFPDYRIKLKRKFYLRSVSSTLDNSIITKLIGLYNLNFGTLPSKQDIFDSLEIAIADGNYLNLYKRTTYANEKYEVGVGYCKYFKELKPIQEVRELIVNFIRDFNKPKFDCKKGNLITNNDGHYSFCK